MNDPIVVTRELVKRGWSDIEPKLVTALASGAATAFVVEVAKQFGIEVPAAIISAAPLVCALLVGYLTPSVGTTVTKKTTLDSGGTVQETEAHSGPVVSTFTAPTAVQRITAPVITPPAVQNETLVHPDNKATEIIPDPAVGKFDHILSQLPSNTNADHAGDVPPWMNR